MVKRPFNHQPCWLSAAARNFFAAAVCFVSDPFGQVVKASTSGALDRGSIPALAVALLSRWSHVVAMVVPVVAMVVPVESRRDHGRPGGGHGCPGGGHGCPGGGHGCPGGGHGCPGGVTPVTQRLVLRWIPCQTPGVLGSARGLVGPVSVCFDWVR